MHNNSERLVMLYTMLKFFLITTVSTSTPIPSSSESMLSDEPPGTTTYPSIHRDYGATIASVLVVTVLLLVIAIIMFIFVVKFRQSRTGKMTVISNSNISGSNNITHVGIDNSAYSGIKWEEKICRMKLVYFFD